MTTVGTLQAEAMTSTAGYGAIVTGDSTASAGKTLVLDSAVTVRASVTLAGLAARLVLRARTDGSPARMVVAIDGLPFPETVVSYSTWSNYIYARNLAAGPHTVTIKFVNPETRNLLLDVLTFDGTVTPPASTETKLTAYLTGYSWQDNDPPKSAAIACTKWRGLAGGTGTFADPITMAVGFVGSLPDLPYGTLFYVPTLRRYFRIEDLCGACHGSPRPAGTAIWLDCWVGGQDTTAAIATAAMNALTGSHTVIKNPVNGYVVVTGSLSKTGVTLYGETAVKV